MKRKRAAPPASVELPAGDEPDDKKRCRFCGRQGEKRRGSGKRGRASTRFMRCVRTQPQKRKAGQNGQMSGGSPSLKFFGAGILIKSTSAHPEFQLFKTSCWSCDACGVKNLNEATRLEKEATKRDAGTSTDEEQQEGVVCGEGGGAAAAAVDAQSVGWYKRPGSQSWRPKLREGTHEDNVKSGAEAFGRLRRSATRGIKFETAFLRLPYRQRATGVCVCLSVSLRACVCASLSLCVCLSLSLSLSLSLCVSLSLSVSLRRRRRPLGAGVVSGGLVAPGQRCPEARQRPAPCQRPQHLPAHVELDFWSSKMKNLEGIQDQLLSDAMQQVKVVLADARSSYTPVLEKVIDDVKSAYAECQDITLYAHRPYRPFLCNGEKSTLCA